MNMKKTILRLTSMAILSTTLISFITITSYGATYYGSHSYNSSSSNSINRYYSRNNNTSSWGSVTRYYSRDTQSHDATNSLNTQSDDLSTSTSLDNSSSSSTISDDISFKADALTEKMFTLINNERRKNGLEELILDEKLTSVARLKAKDMVANNYLSHTSPTYGSIYTMIKSAGIKYNNAGENIAKAFSVDSAHNNFMHSYMHKRAILADHFTHVGIGIEKEKNGMYKISVMFIEAK